ncbi:MAG: hypothetical protein IPF98_21560 [Gemmatimonadetes bacterium]|nr:hypothetical protein [Gemmatimonadota bacterium]
MVEMTQGPAIAGAAPTAREMLQAFVAQRNELRNQLEQVTGERLSIARRLREGEVSGVDKLGLESRLQALDARTLELTQSLAAADLRVSTQMGVPGASVPPSSPRNNRPQDDWWLEMGFVLALVLLVPSSLAMARRIWRRGSTIGTPAPMSPDLDDRLIRLEQAVDAVAVEVERVGEGQRYVTRILGAGAAEPIEARAAERYEVPR